MAIASYDMSTIKRSDGRCATAAAAYIACCLIEDRTTGEVFDYRRKGGLSFDFTVLPDGNPVDRADLWNAAEEAENRHNSVVARTIIIALPHEADDFERQLLVSDHARYLAKRHGVAVDVAIHEPPREGDERNWHAHFLFTTRKVEVDAEGRIKLGAKTRELDVPRTGGPALEEMRQVWGDSVNARLKRKGVSLSMKSLKAQGLDRQAGTHDGPALTALRRKELRLRKERRKLYITDDPERRRELLRFRKLAKAPALAPVMPVPERTPEPVPPQRTRYWEPMKPPRTRVDEPRPVPPPATVTPAPVRASTPAPTPAPTVPPRPRLDLAAQVREAAAQRRPVEPARPAPALEQAPAPVPTATVTPRQGTPPRAAPPPEVPAALKVEPVQPEQAAPVRNGPVPISPFRNRKGEPRDPAFVLAASTIIHAHDTGNTRLLRAATRLLAAVIDKTFKVAELAAGQLIAWGRENSRAGLPRPIQTPEACLDRAQNIQRNRGGRGL